MQNNVLKNNNNKENHYIVPVPQTTITCVNIICLYKLNKIREIDTVSNTVTVESGCILQSINDQLESYNLQMPISLGSKGSCQIGGNIATNAGGLNVIKFGSIRSNILGIEAILPNGELYNDLKTVKKIIQG